MVDLVPITEIKKAEIVEKPIDDVNISDIKFKVNAEKSYEEQAEDIVGAMTTAGAIHDEKTFKDLQDKKSEELKAKADAKTNEAKAKATEEETNEQKAERKLYEAVLETFGIYKHLPKWLMQIVVGLLTPFYIILICIVGIPTGFVKFLIDSLDGIFVRYEEITETTKPQVKVITWVLLGVVVLSIIALTTLACLKII